MPAYRRSLRQLLADHRDAPYDPERREFIEDIAAALYEREPDLPPIAQWPESVRFFYACYDINFQVGFGGFAQAAYNAPHLLPVARDAFLRLGRRKAAELCARAVALLPAAVRASVEKGLDDAPGLDEVFDHFDDSMMSTLNEEIRDDFWVDAELQALVERNREAFAAMDDLAGARGRAQAHASEAE